MTLRALVPALLTAAALLVPAAANAGDVIVANESQWSIYQLYMSPSSSDTWGTDHLGEAIISSGSKHTLHGVSCDTYDIKLVDEDGDKCVVSGVSMCGDPTVWKIDSQSLLECQGTTAVAGTTSASSSSTVTVKNSSLWTIYRFFLSASTDSNWGPDHLGDGVVRTGQTFTMANIPCGTYDIKIVDEDEDACVLNGVSLCGEAAEFDLTSERLLACQNSSGGSSSTSSVSTGGSSAVVVKNSSLWTIYRFFMSLSTDSSWGTDHLGDDVVRTGQTFTLSNIPCGVYDLKIVDEDEDECVLKGVSLCGEAAELDLTNQALLECQAGL